MASLTTRDQHIYNKILGTKTKSMTMESLYTEFATIPKNLVMASCSALLHSRLLASEKDKNGMPIMKAKSLEEARKPASGAWTNEQKLVFNCIKEAQRNGISLASLRKKVAVVSMNQVIMRKALEALVKGNNIKTFKPINSPTMTMYILSHLSPPEEVTGGVWYNANQGYDTALVHSLCQVLLKRTRDLTFPKSSKDDDSNGRSNKPILPFAKSRLPSPNSLLAWIKDKRLTTAALTVKNVMECMRALELDGRVETIKPLSMGHFDMGDDEPGPSKRRKTDADGSDDSEDDMRKEKEKQKAKEKAKEKKRRAKEKEKKEKKRKEKERAKRKKEKEKEREKKKKRKKEKDKKKRAGSSDDDDDSDVLREVDDDAPKKKRKRSLSVSSLSSSSSSSDSDSDSDVESDSGSEVSSVDSDDIDDRDVELKPVSSGFTLTMSNPFDLSDTQVVYRATRRLDESILLGQMQTPCGRCPQFTFCEESGPVNATDCEYYNNWLADKEGGGGWDRGGALEKMRPELKNDEDDVEAVAPANGDEAANGDDIEADANDAYDGMDVEGGYAEEGEVPYE